MFTVGYFASVSSMVVKDKVKNLLGVQNAATKFLYDKPYLKQCWLCGTSGSIMAGSVSCMWSKTSFTVCIADCEICVVPCISILEQALNNHPFIYC